MSRKSPIQLAPAFKIIILLLLAGCIAMALVCASAAKEARTLNAACKEITDKIDEINQAGGLEGIEEEILRVRARTEEATIEKESVRAQQDKKAKELADVTKEKQDSEAKLANAKKDNGKALIEELTKESDTLKEEYISLMAEYSSFRASQTKDPEQPFVAYLTFDDGPSKNTDKILDILAQYNIKATFFVTWQSGDTAAARYKRILAEEHTIGNHTASHDWKKVYGNPDKFISEVTLLRDNLYNLTGYTTKIFRFPGGSSNTRCGGSVSSEPKWQRDNNGGKRVLLKECIRWLYLNGYQYFDWNVNSTDADKALETKENIVKSVLTKADNLKKNGYHVAIVLMHDASGKTTTVEALPEVIEGLIAQGYTFGTLAPDSIPYRSVTLSDLNW